MVYQKNICLLYTSSYDEKPGIQAIGSTTPDLPPISNTEKGLDKDEKEKETGRYIRRERYAGACSRSFYVGKEVHQDDIKACLLYTSRCV